MPISPIGLSGETRWAPAYAGATVGFEKAFGIKADTMLRMQAAVDLARAGMREREILVDRVAA